MLAIISASFRTFICTISSQPVFIYSLTTLFIIVIILVGFINHRNWHLLWTLLFRVRHPGMQPVGCQRYDYPTHIGILILLHTYHYHIQCTSSLYYYKIQQVTPGNIHDVDTILNSFSSIVYIYMNKYIINIIPPVSPLIIIDLVSPTKLNTLNNLKNIYCIYE